VICECAVIAISIRTGFPVTQRGNLILRGTEAAASVLHPFASLTGSLCDSKRSFAPRGLPKASTSRDGYRGILTRERDATPGALPRRTKLELGKYVAQFQRADVFDAGNDLKVAATLTLRCFVLSIWRGSIARLSRLEAKLDRTALEDATCYAGLTLNGIRMSSAAGGVGIFGRNGHVRGRLLSAGAMHTTRPTVTTSMLPRSRPA